MAVQKILKEDTEATVVISDEDVTLYAQQLGIDISKEKHLLWIAQKGLETPVPKPWYPVEDEKGRIYYYNYETDDSTWEHPADSHFRELVKQEREKQIIKKENTEIAVDTEPSSLDDVPPITSGRTSMSTTTEDKNMKTLSGGRKSGLLSKLNEVKDKEKSTSFSILKNSTEINMKSEDNQKSPGKKASFDDHFLKSADFLMKQGYDNRHNIRFEMDFEDSEKSQSSLEATDNDLSTGLDGLGFDRFAEQYGLMDASKLSPMIRSPEIMKKNSFLKSKNQTTDLEPVPNNLLQSLFNTSVDIEDKDISVNDNVDGERFSDFLKEIEELNTKTAKLEKHLSENKSQADSSEHVDENTASDIIKGTDGGKDLLKIDEKSFNDEMKISLSINENYNKFEQNLHDIDEVWTKKLEEKEEYMRLQYEKEIQQLQEELDEKKKLEEMKINDAIKMIKEENGSILAKQEQVLTEELEADLESVKEEMELKKLAALDNLRLKLEEDHKKELSLFQTQLEEKHKKEIEEKQQYAETVLSDKIQNLMIEMEKEMGEKKKTIQLNHQQEIEKLMQENVMNLEEIKSDLEKKGENENSVLSNEIEILKDELENIKKSIESNKHILEDLEEKKILLEKYHIEETELVNNLKILKDNNLEEEKSINDLLEKKKSLHIEISKLEETENDKKLNLEKLTSESEKFQSEIKSLNENLKVDQQIEKKPLTVDKYTDTNDLLKDITEHKFENLSTENRSLNENILDNSLTITGKPKEASVSEKEDKMEVLAIKMDALEKAFNLLEKKIGRSIESGSVKHFKNYDIDESSEKKQTDEEKDVKSVSFDSASKLKEDEKIECKRKNLKDEKFTKSPFIHNDITDQTKYDENPIYTINQSDDLSINDNSFNDVYQNINMNLQNLKFATVSENETQLVPFIRTDVNTLLKDYRQKLNNLQAKHQSSQLKLEFIKEDILNEVSSKILENETKREVFNESCNEAKDKLHNMPHIENSYSHNVLPTSVTSLIMLPTRTVQSNKWNSDVLEKAQQFIQKEVHFNDRNSYPNCVLYTEKGTEPLDQFFTLTETVLDKELGLLSKKKNKKHYLSCPSLTGYKSFSSSSSLASSESSNDHIKRENIATGIQNDYRLPTYLNHGSSLRKMISEREDWMEKLGTMYHQIRSYERDLFLKRSLKHKV